MKACSRGSSFTSKRAVVSAASPLRRGLPSHLPSLPVTCEEELAVSNKLYVCVMFRVQPFPVDSAQLIRLVYCMVKNAYSTVLCGVRVHTMFVGLFGFVDIKKVLYKFVN